MLGDNSGHIGGVERQVSIMSKWLAKKNHEISMIIWDDAKNKDMVINGVKIIKICNKNDGIKGLRFIYPRWSSLCRGLSRADADLYYHNCAEDVTGQIAIWCKIKKRKFIYSIASDMECKKDLPTLNKREKLLYKYGIKNADQIICQTKKQNIMLKKIWNLNSIVLKMPCIGLKENDYIQKEPPSKNSCKVIWVGRISREKRLELFIEVAKEIKDIQFEIIGQPDEEENYTKRLIDSVNEIGNLNYFGRATRKQLENIYLNSSILCCTSLYEGFPNTFLEAWSYGLPVISTIDPD